METDKKLETMEEELKLLKGELKQSLASVRDYLLNMELPSSEFATVLAALGADGSQKIELKGSLLSGDKDSGFGKPLPEEEETTPGDESEEEEETAPGDESEEEEETALGEGSEEEEETALREGSEEEEFLGPEDELSPEGEDLINQDENLEPEDELLSEAEPDELNESLMPESELPIEEEEPSMVQVKTNAELSQSTPKVNMLVSLMHWVAMAKKEIGSEQLPAFLEVYGISGHLSMELKELILHMADIASEQSEDDNSAETWSRAMLSLHGILTGGDAPAYPMKPFWNDEDNDIQPNEDKVTKTEIDKPEDTPFKLKLVVPNGEGKNQEFFLDLKPGVANNGSQEAPDSREHLKERGDVLWPQRQPRRKM